jgi:hypothetical protein
VCMCMGISVCVCISVRARGSEFVIPVLDERSLSGMTYTPGSDLSERLGDIFQPLGEEASADGAAAAADSPQALFPTMKGGGGGSGGGGGGGGRSGGGKGEVSAEMEAAKAEFLKRVLERGQQEVEEWGRQQELVLQRIDAFLDADGLRFVCALAPTRAGVQDLFAVLQAVEMGWVRREGAAGEDRGVGQQASRPRAQVAPEGAGAVGRGGKGEGQEDREEEEESGDYVIFDASELGLVFTDAGSRVMMPGDGADVITAVENLTASPKLSLEVLFL